MLSLRRRIFFFPYLLHYYFYNHICIIMNEQCDTVVLSPLYFNGLLDFLPATPDCHLLSSMLQETERHFFRDSLVYCPGRNLFFDRGAWKFLRAHSSCRWSAVDLMNRRIISNFCPLCSLPPCHTSTGKSGINSNDV